MRLSLLAVLLAPLAFPLSCASSRDVAGPPPPAPDGSVIIVRQCSDDTPTVALWNPSATTRRCHVDSLGPFPFLLPPFQLVSAYEVDLVAPGEPICTDVADDSSARAASAGVRLDDPEPAIRRAAAEAIGELGPRGRDAVGALVARIQIETDDMALFNMTEALVHVLGLAAIPQLIDALQMRGNDDGRARLSATITGFGEAAAAELVPRLSEPVVAAAFRTDDLLRIDLDAGRDLLRSRIKEHPALEIRALESYLKARPGDAEMGRLALEALASPDANIRYRATSAIAQLRSRQAVDALVRALSDPARRVIFKAAEGIGLIAQVERALIPVEAAETLAALLPTDDETLAWHATMALGRIGHDTPRVRDALAAVASSGDARLKLIAAASTVQLDGRMIDPSVLRAGLESTEPSVRGLAAGRVLELGQLAAPLVDTLDALLSASVNADANGGVTTLLRERWVELLLGMGPTARPALMKVAAGQPVVPLSTWLQVVETVGTEAAASIAPRLCEPSPRAFKDVDAAIVRMRLGQASPTDRALFLDGLARTHSADLARKLAPFAHALGLTDNDRAVISWLASNHAYAHARAALTKLARVPASAPTTDRSVTKPFQQRRKLARL